MKKRSIGSMMLAGALQELIDEGTYKEISEKWFDRDLLDIDLEGVELLE